MPHSKKQARHFFDRVAKASDTDHTTISFSDIEKMVFVDLNGDGLNNDNQTIYVKKVSTVSQYTGRTFVDYQYKTEKEYDLLSDNEKRHWCIYKDSDGREVTEKSIIDNNLDHWKDFYEHAMRPESADGKRVNFEEFWRTLQKFENRTQS